MEIHIIRHTKVAVSKEICYGQSQVPLADTFPMEAEKYKNELPLADFDAVYCSPMLRCKSLVRSFEFEEVNFDDRLKEMNFGAWEGKKWNDIDQQVLMNWMEDFVNVKAPEGENLQMLYNRCESFFDELIQNDFKKVLVVTHAGLIRCIWGYVLEIPLAKVFRIPMGFGETLVIKHSKNKAYRRIKRKM